MKTNKKQILNLIRIANGEKIAKTKLNGELVRKLLDDHSLMLITRGKGACYAARDKKYFRRHLCDILNTENLEAYADMMGRQEVSRAEQTKLTGNSKTKRKRTFKGFLVNSYEPIKAKLGVKDITVNPDEGTFTFIYDFEDFKIPPNVVVVGIENSEDFREIRKQKYLFDKFLLPNEKVIFVNRYPTNQINDLRKWLMKMPNRYLHFGDFDLKGVDIYLKSFYKHLGERASFLIPDDVEERVKNGEDERYNVQYRPGEGKVIDPSVQPLIDLIHKYHKGYDQEGYIKEYENG